MGSSNEGMALKKSMDPWAFLEEIEAPTWVDLTEEVNCYKQDKDDYWFHISHRFHQCSSQLKPMFSGSGEVSSTIDFDSVEESSPKITSSVSRSRGKDYKSKRWEAIKAGALLSKQKSLKILVSNSSCVDSNHKDIELKPRILSSKEKFRSKTSLATQRRLGDNAKAKHLKQASTSWGSGNRSISVVEKVDVTNTTSEVTVSNFSCVDSNNKDIELKQKFVSSKEQFGSTTSLDTRRSLAENAKTKHLKQASTSWDSENCSSSVLDKADVTNTTSEVPSENVRQHQEMFGEATSRATRTSSSGGLPSVTSDCNQQQHKRLLEVSGRARGTTSGGLLSALKISLRKSCATRPASRVEISSSGRPSTFEIYIQSLKTRNSKSSSGKSSVGSSSNPACSKGDTEQTPNSKNFNNQAQLTKSKVRVPMVSKAPAIIPNKATCNTRNGVIHYVAKAAHHEAAKPKVQFPSLCAKLNERTSCPGGTKAKEKVLGNRPNRMVGVGKENVAGRMTTSQELIGKEHVSRGVKGTKCVPQKSTQTRLVATKGKISVRTEGKSSKRVIQRPHFR